VEKPYPPQHAARQGGEGLLQLLSQPHALLQGPGRPWVHQGRAPFAAVRVSFEPMGIQSAVRLGPGLWFAQAANQLQAPPAGWVGSSMRLGSSISKTPWLHLARRRRWRPDGCFLAAA